MRLQRLHFSSTPSARSFATRWPHSHLASAMGVRCGTVGLEIIRFENYLFKSVKRDDYNGFCSG